VTFTNFFSISIKKEKEKRNKQTNKQTNKLMIDLSEDVFIDKTDFECFRFSKEERERERERRD